MSSDAPLFIHLRPLTREDAESIAKWHYDGPWSVYDPRPAEGLLQAEEGYFAVVDGSGILLGFACIGAEARVPGLYEEPGIVDLGVGMDPERVGRGQGSAFLEAVIDHVHGIFGDVPMRAAVQAWNERALRLTARLGFRVIGSVSCVQDGKEVRYCVLHRGAPVSRPKNP